eukprot:1341342-Prymnesium_polylepis.3
MRGSCARERRRRRPRSERPDRDQLHLESAAAALVVGGHGFASAGAAHTQYIHPRRGTTCTLPWARANLRNCSEMRRLPSSAHPSARSLCGSAATRSKRSRVR